MATPPIINQLLDNVYVAPVTGLLQNRQRTAPSMIEVSLARRIPNHQNQPVSYEQLCANHSQIVDQMTPSNAVAERLHNIGFIVLPANMCLSKVKIFEFLPNLRQTLREPGDQNKTVQSLIRDKNYFVCFSDTDILTCGAASNVCIQYNQLFPLEVTKAGVTQYQRLTLSFNIAAKECSINVGLELSFENGCKSNMTIHKDVLPNLSSFFRGYPSARSDDKLGDQIVALIKPAGIEDHLSSLIEELNVDSLHSLDLVFKRASNKSTSVSFKGMTSDFMIKAELLLPPSARRNAIG